jgi:hypothetical protein
LLEKLASAEDGITLNRLPKNWPVSNTEHRLLGEQKSRSIPDHASWAISFPRLATLARIIRVGRSVRRSICEAAGHSVGAVPIGPG